MLDFITIYNRLIIAVKENKLDNAPVHIRNLNAINLQEHLNKISLISNSQEELDSLYHIIILSYIYSITTDYTIWIKLDTIEKDEQIVPANEFYIYTKVPNVKLFLTVEEIKFEQNCIIIFPNISQEELKIISEKNFSVLFYNNPELNSFSNNIITIVKEKDSCTVIVKNKTYDMPSVSIPTINTVLRKLQELFIKNYLNSPKQLLLNNWENFVENGKLKRGKLDEAAQTLFGKKSNKFISQKIYSLIEELSTNKF